FAALDQRIGFRQQVGTAVRRLELGHIGIVARLAETGGLVITVGDQIIVVGQKREFAHGAALWIGGGAGCCQLLPGSSSVLVSRARARAGSINSASISA